MEFFGKRIIESARAELQGFVYETIVKIYLLRHGNINPNFAEDEEYVLGDFNFSYDIEVSNTYTDEYYRERREAIEIRATLDGVVYLVGGENNDETNIYELSTDELERLACAMEEYYNKVKAKE